MVDLRLPVRCFTAAALVGGLYFGWAIARLNALRLDAGLQSIRELRLERPEHTPNAPDPTLEGPMMARVVHPETSRDDFVLRAQWTMQESRRHPSRLMKRTVPVGVPHRAPRLPVVSLSQQLVAASADARHLIGELATQGDVDGAIDLCGDTLATWRDVALSHRLWASADAHDGTSSTLAACRAALQPVTPTQRHRLKSMVARIAAAEPDAATSVRDVALELEYAWFGLQYVERPQWMHGFTPHSEMDLMSCGVGAADEGRWRWASVLPMWPVTPVQQLGCHQRGRALAARANDFESSGFADAEHAVRECYPALAADFFRIALRHEAARSHLLREYVAELDGKIQQRIR